MTLNLMLISRSAVYLSGDFRLTYAGGRWWSDRLNVQKLVPVFKFGWSALVSFTGVAERSHTLRLSASPAGWQLRSTAISEPQGLSCPGVFWPRSSPPQDEPD